jgi:hypothetical protein
VWRPDEFPARVDLLDLATGGRRLWHQIAVSDPIGVNRISALAITPDARAYSYV